MVLKESNPDFPTSLYHLARFVLAPAFMECLLKIILNEWLNEYALLTSGYSLNKIFALSFCESVHLSADLKSK